ncbi:MAG TPA: OmpA family protein [Paracoccaceae bacterium]|nr:OmpA family protein [Paracoccaceae bacterium]HMO71004.1 OmpA family protein [Paracoccaceae bacterium]
MRITPVLFAISLAFTLSAGAPALAQAADKTGASADELKSIFQRQKSRGLTLAPGTGVATGIANASDGTSISAPGLASDAVVPVSYNALEAEDQINISVAFDFDSAVLRDSEKVKLAELCTAMQGATDIGVFRIVGHTDAAGSDEYNDRLSLLRAEEVKRHLVSDCGIASDRLEAVGVGKRFLSDPADPRGEVNRRVEFQAMS